MIKLYYKASCMSNLFRRLTHISIDEEVNMHIAFKQPIVEVSHVLAHKELLMMTLFNLVSRLKMVNLNRQYLNLSKSPHLKYSYTSMVMGLVSPPESVGAHFVRILSGCSIIDRACLPNSE